MGMAPSLIEAVGGRIYCLNNFDRTKGSNTAAVTKLKENDALDHYSTVFSKPETISGSCADYASAAEGEPKEQEDDQARGKKIKVPTMVLYSASNLGQMHDVEGLWKNWVDGSLNCVALVMAWVITYPRRHLSRPRSSLRNLLLRTANKQE